MRTPDLRWQLFGLVALLVSSVTVPAAAQTGRDIPTTEYWLARGAYYDGDFATARKAFQDAARGGIKSADGRWVDSVCYHVMLGECLYEMGNLTQALDQYASALQLYVAYQNWMLQVEFPANLDVETRLPKITWGTPTRTTRIGKYPNRYPIIQNTTSLVGDLGKDAQLVSGQQATLIGAQEIARCTALAIRRRREIMGPTCVHDRLTDQVVAALSRRPAPPNSWSHAWVSVQLGLAYSSAGKQELALAELTKGLQAGGAYDHLMTSLALLEMGDIHFQQGKYDAAGIFYLEATYSAAMFGQYDDMEAGFRGAQLCWLLTGKNTAFLPLANATAWAGDQKVRKLEVALRLLAAENLTLIGNAADAAALLATAQKGMYKREMLLGRPGARWNFEMARIAFADGNTADGAANLAVAMKFQQASSKWLFQIGLADALVTGNSLSEREADSLYADLLRDLTAKDWSIDPLESLTVASTSYAAALEHWFEVAMRRKEPEKALEIADRIRRHRFYSTLPLGGRLLALRWILEAPKESLDAKALLQRQDLIIKYPNYARASLQATTLQQDLAKLPLLPTDDEQRKQQANLLAQLAKTSALQEVILRNIALRREPSDYAFPPTLDVKQLQKAIPERTLVLCYINISGKLMGFALGKEKYASFPVATAPQLKAELAGMYKAWGLREKNQLVDAKDLLNDSWRSTARRLMKSLTNNMKDENWANFDEVVIVPDSVLWYMPFEALPLSDEANAPPLISKVRVRYVPTLSLATPDASSKPTAERTGIVAGKLFPRDDMAISAGEYEKIAAAIPTAASLTNKLPVVSSLFASQLDQLVVYHDLDETNARGAGPYDWSPLPVDRAKTASFLGEWISLPWNAPRQVVLPGFHTPVESGLRKGGTGDELFLTSCAFLASGSKTLLLSRWRAGGQTSYDLSREFAIESPHTAASAAWQRSVHLAMHAPVDFSREPRLEASAQLDGLDASHPFFWSGYLLVDTGSEPKSDKPKVIVAKPEVKEPAAKEFDAKKPDAERKPGEEKKPAEEKKPDAKPAKVADDEVDGKLPPDLEALRKESPAKEKRAAGKEDEAKGEPLKPRRGSKAAPKKGVQGKET